MIDRKTFYAAVRTRLFGGLLTQGQVDGMNAVLDEWERRGLSDLRWLAYMLATAKWETNATMQPVREAYWLSEEWRRTHLRYYPFYGRGLVQLTWEENYRKMSVALARHFPGLDMVRDPERACELDVAVAILFEGMLRAETGVGDFTGHSLEQYFAGEREDPVGARRIINGTDRAEAIAGLYYSFLQSLRDAAADQAAA